MDDISLKQLIAWSKNQAAVAEKLGVTQQRVSYMMLSGPEWRVWVNRNREPVAYYKLVRVKK